MHIPVDTLGNDALFDESIITDSDIVQPDSLETDAQESNTATDSLQFDFPEGMTAEIDSLLNGWQARNLLKSFECDTEGWENIKVSDTLYAKRLSLIPSVINMPYNRMVRQCIDRYTTRNRSLVSYMLGISEFYMPMIENEIDKYNMPHELKYLPVIESALNPKAVSRAGAKGLWQFMFATGKLYGLKSNMKSLRGSSDGTLVLIKADQAAVLAHAPRDLEGMSAAAGGAVNIGEAVPYVQRIDAFEQKNGGMGKGGRHIAPLS